MTKARMQAWQYGLMAAMLMCAVTAAAEGTRSSELELNWNAAIGNATYEENDSVKSLSSAGVLLEINPGILVTTAPGLDVGVTVGFVILNSTGNFAIEYEGPPTNTRNWEVSAITLGSYALAQYEYVLDLSGLTLGIENGLGAGFFITSVTADWVDASDGDISGSTSEEERTWTPVAKLALNADLPVSEASSLGLNLGVLIVPMQAGDYLNFATFTVGLGYRVEY